MAQTTFTRLLRLVSQYQNAAGVAVPVPSDDVVSQGDALARQERSHAASIQEATHDDLSCAECQEVREKRAGLTNRLLSEGIDLGDVLP